LVLQPVSQKPADITDFVGWPQDFFKITAGAFRDKPLEREVQGKYEIRESIK